MFTGFRSATASAWRPEGNSSDFETMELLETLTMADFDPIPTCTEPYRIRCAEVWGGILAIDTDLVTAGLSASIFSTALDGDQGGDMYYVSVCKWDYLTRIAIADLRGHGGQVSRLSAWVYESMQKRMNTASGYKILADLNDTVKTRGFDAITTAVVVGYHNDKQKLYFSYAGHPPAYVQ